MKLYHGTNNDPSKVAQWPEPKASVNGTFFYVTNDPAVARKYGTHVICWEIEEIFINPLGLQRFTIDQSYMEGISSYEDCVAGGFEYRLNKVEAANLALDATLVGYYDARSRYYKI